MPFVTGALQSGCVTIAGKEHGSGVKEPSRERFPLPQGEGRGEGIHLHFLFFIAHFSKEPLFIPHPDLLPEGEGTVL